MKLKIISSLFIFIIVSLFALYSDHRWEDWYITFKSAKNLAIGNGLVYHVGERLMTFTSPLGVLIPAFIKWLFINKSDDYVIWIFRIFNIFLISFVPFFIIDILKKLHLSNYLIYITMLLIGFNILIIDNTINGMESALMVFFISYLLWCLFNPPKKPEIHLALCFIGLMYTRPDGIIYGGAMLFSFFSFFNQAGIKSRINFGKTLLKACLIAGVIYLPWFIGTWIYYGTPVPHTVIAKSVSRTYELIPMILGFLAYNFRIMTFQSVETGSLFMPAYSWAFGTWEYGIKLNIISSFFGLVISYYWLLPRGNNYARILSLAVYLINFYLARVSGQGAMPWYLPSVILPSILCLILISHQLLAVLKSDKSYLKYIVWSFNIFLVVFSIIIFYYGAIQLKSHQNIVEFDNRKEIGLWLRENSSPDDRIFMECLGYIGFYSGLKTLDYPGMSSPEVVSARKELGEFSFDMPKLVYILKPEWLILREWEYTQTQSINPEIFNELFQLEKTFNVINQVKEANLKFGSGYLYHDALFLVFKRKMEQDET